MAKQTLFFLPEADSGTFDVVDIESLSLFSWAKWLLLEATLKNKDKELPVNCKDPVCSFATHIFEELNNEVIKNNHNFHFLK